MTHDVHSPAVEIDALTQLCQHRRLKREGRRSPRTSIVRPNTKLCFGAFLLYARC